jgi:uncharacterized protein with GYD domain
MAKYLIIAAYTAEGAKGLLKDSGTKRRQAAEQAIKSAGGTMEAFYFAFGDDDAYVIVDAPDHASMAAASLAINASGAVETKTVVLLSAEEIDQAIKKTVNYRAPGH